MTSYCAPLLSCVLNKICHIKANTCHPQCSRAVLTIVPGHFIGGTTIHTLLKQVHNFIMQVYA